MTVDLREETIKGGEGRVIDITLRHLLKRGTVAGESIDLTDITVIIVSMKETTKSVADIAETATRETLIDDIDIAMPIDIEIGHVLQKTALIAAKTDESLKMWNKLNINSFLIN